MDRLLQVMQAAVDAHWAQPAPVVDIDETHGSAVDVDEAPGAGVAQSGQAKRAAVESRVASIDEKSMRRSHRAIATRVVQQAVLARSRLFAGIPGDRRRQPYVTLQTTIGERVTAGVVAVTSPHRGAGTTLTAVNVAMSLAIDARRDVVVVDLDLERPSIHRLFDIEPETGLEDCLFEGADLDTALFSPSIERLAVLAGRGACTSPAQVLRSSQVPTLLSAIRERIPGCIVVADLPPVTTQSDAAAIESFSDGVLLVVAHESTRAADYARGLDAFSESKLIGTVLNRVPTSS